MPKVEEFHASKATRDEMIAALAGLPADKAATIVQAIASLATEIQIYTRRQAMEQLRQEWSNNLRVMLGTLPVKVD